jgi:hypothetical protein
MRLLALVQSRSRFRVYSELNTIITQEAGENVGKYTNPFYVNLGLSEPLFFYPKVSHTPEERSGG